MPKIYQCEKMCILLVGRSLEEEMEIIEEKKPRKMLQQFAMQVPSINIKLKLQICIKSITKDMSQMTPKDVSQMTPKDVTSDTQKA